VRVCALDALAGLGPEDHRWTASEVDTLVSCLEQRDKRVVHAAARLTSVLPDADWGTLERQIGKQQTRPRIGLALARVWRTPRASEAIIDTALAALHPSEEPDIQLAALRLIVLAFDDWQLREPAIDAFTGYAVASSLKGRETLVRRVLQGVRPLFPSRDERVSAEAARLLAMLEDEDPDVLPHIASFWSKTSSPTQDVHYLVVLARLPGKRDPSLARKTADAILSLDRKLEGQQQRNKQNWSVRLAEVTTYLLKHDPGLADALLAHPEFVRPSHVQLATCLPPDQQRRAAERYLAAVQADAEFAWSGPLLDLLQQLSAEQVRPLLRRQWENYGLRDAILLRLAEPPEIGDRAHFLTGLESSQGRVLRVCLTALERLPRDETPKNLVPILALLHRLQSEPKEVELRRQALALIGRQSGSAFRVTEDRTDAPSLKRAYQPVFAWFEKEQPKLARAVYGADEEDEAAWKRLLQRVDWSQGDATRGAVLFRNRACVTCHTGSSRIGPDLLGVASRFSRDDLFTALIYPSRDVAPAYRVTVIETRNGQVFSGIVAFESADGVILQTGATDTVRIATEDIASRLPSNRSLMPNGLLKDLKPTDLADLYSYLQTLKAAAK
jgi:putative heme-binding domain-containing protein